MTNHSEFLYSEAHWTMPAIIQPRPEPAHTATVEDLYEAAEPTEVVPFLKVDLTTLWRQRWTILLTILAFLALGAVYLASRPRCSSRSRA